jgi:hypothetical protein
MSLQSKGNRGQKLSLKRIFKSGNWKKIFFVQPYAKRALCVPKTGREIGFRGRCKPNLYVFIDSEVNFACSFYNNYKFSRDCLASAASRLGDNFSLGTLKNDFAALIYK